MAEKYYQLGTHTAEQWQEVHNELCTETSGLSNVPDRACTCTDDKEHSPTRGIFLLTDEEAAELKNDPRIQWINIDYSSYPETYKAPPDEIQATPVPLIERYSGTVKNYKDFENANSLPPSPGAADINRTGYQILRLMQETDPWVGQSDQTVITDNLQQAGTGKHVDVIVADDGGGWIGHPEFQNNCSGEKPYGYEGGNPLPGNGTCDVVDVYLDSPIYLDPDYFAYPTPQTISISTSSANGTTDYVVSGTDRDGSVSGNDPTIRIFVGDTLNFSNTIGAHPLYFKTVSGVADTNNQVEGVAGAGATNGTVSWTPTEPGTYYYQCSSHASMWGTITVDLGDNIEQRWDGTHVPTETAARNWWLSSANRSATFNAKGVNFSINVTSAYTRAYCNGSNTTQSSVGQHCTPCMALTYGRTQGWAYNANKWVLNLYGTNGSDIEPGFDIQKIFHQTKPINPLYGTKNPTVSSNSWGYRASKGSNPGWYHFREDAPVQYNGTGDEPTFISHMGSQGDLGRWKSEMKSNSLTTALDELITSGVIFVAAAGNSNQKQVKPDHQDYDNFVSLNSDDTIAESSYFEFGVETTGTTNRRGFPQQGGKSGTGVNTIYPVINIGALDDDHATGELERKVGYSDRGNDIDVYTPADGTLAANRSYTSEGVYPDTYPGFTANSGSGAGVPEDCAFGGTSAACPVAAGFISTLMELNREWTWQDVKAYLGTLNLQTDFYTGSESTSANDSNWTDYNSLEGGDARVMYQNNITQTSFPKRAAKAKSGVNFKSINITYRKRFDRGY